MYQRCAITALVISDSLYGHTQKLALAVVEAIGGQVLRVGELNPADPKAFDLLLLGSPAHGGFPTSDMDGLLQALPAHEGVNIAAFDTRTKTTIFGYAASRIARSLERKGGNLVAPPEGFLVLGIRGPLEDGELERARGWAKTVAASSAATRRG